VAFRISQGLSVADSFDSVGNRPKVDSALFQENERLTPQNEERQVADVGSLQCEQGGKLERVQVTFETWGALNAGRSNAILVCHALSGDSHAIGWWERLIGPGKAIDPADWFIIGTNCLGGCQGTTGPSSLDEGGNRYGANFPVVTIRDMVDVQAKLLDFLGIERLKMVCGGSMGGMQALEWTARWPSRVESAWVTASCAAHSAMQIGFNEAARQAVMRDPKWNGGHYDPLDPPVSGLAVARMIGHLSFLSEHSFAAKFGRDIQNGDAIQYLLEPEFQVESYLNYQGDKFTKRFDANSFIYLTKAIDWYELKSLNSASARFLFTSFASDWLYPSHQSRRLHSLATSAGLESEFHEIDLPFGHDSFLLDGEHQGQLVRRFLESI
jgi:homoserine O-acetyltransferase